MSSPPTDLRAAVTAVLGPTARAVRRSLASPDALDDADALHDLRVAVRRLRSDLRTFSPVLESSPTAVLRAELRRVADPLGVVRDLDVQLDLVDRRLRELGQDHRGLGLVSMLLDERVRARRELLDVLTSDRTAALRRDLKSAGRRSPVRRGARGVEPSVALRRLGRRPWLQLASAVSSLGPDPDDRDLHRVRLLAKRARYAADAVAATTDPRAAGLAAALARVQTELGVHQDAAVGRLWLDRAAAVTDDPGEAFVLGEIAGLLRAERDAQRIVWRDAWASADRRRLRRWM